MGYEERQYYHKTPWTITWWRNSEQDWWRMRLDCCKVRGGVAYSDSPIQYRSGVIAYDWPRRAPEYIKRIVERGFRNRPGPLPPYMQDGWTT
jgi:hypothetical protein